MLIDCSSVIFVDVAGARLFTQVSLLKHAIMLNSSLFIVLSVSSCIAFVCVFFCRCVPNARKLEFTCIWQTATVRLAYLNDSAPNVCDEISGILLVKVTCLQGILIIDFYPYRERPEDPHVKRSNDLHEPSTYLCHRAWCRDVHSTAEGKLEVFRNMQKKKVLISRDYR